MIKTLVDFLCYIFISVSTSPFYIYYSAETVYSYHANIKLYMHGTVIQKCLAFLNL